MTRAYWVVAGLMAVAVACAAGKPVQTITREPPPKPPPTPQDEILKYESEMREWRVDLGLKPRPVHAATANGAAAKEVCEGLTECKEPCKLADAICQNAEAICDIAEKEGDAWSRGKCKDAEKSCAEAKDVCTCCERRSENGLLRQQPCAPPPPVQPSP